MKRVTVSILVIAALALAGLAGAGTASARTVICSVNESPCAKANILPSGTAVGGYRYSKDVSFTLDSSSADFTCKGGIFGAISTAESGNPLPATGSMASSYCTWASGGPSHSCGELTVSEPPTTVAATGGGDGTVTYGTEAEHLSFKLTCQFGSSSFTCKWGAASVQLQMDWGETFGASGVSLAREEASGLWSEWFCDGSSKLTIDSEPMAGRYISETPYTVICKVAESPCAKANILPSGSAVGGYRDSKDVSVTLDSAGADFTCKGGVFGAVSTAEAGNPLPATGSMASSYCTWANGGPSLPCSELTVSEPPTTVAATGVGDGTVTYGTEAEHLSFKLTCQYGTSFTCKWGAASVQLQMDWGETFGASKVPLALEEKSGLWSGLCGGSNSTKLTIDSEPVNTSFISLN